MRKKTKQILCLMIILLIGILLSPTTKATDEKKWDELHIVVNETYATSTLKGDVNLDGVVTAADARLIIRQCVALEELTGQALINADIDGNGTVESADARLGLKIAVKLEEDYTGSSVKLNEEIPLKLKLYNIANNEFKDLSDLECDDLVWIIKDSKGNTVEEYEAKIDEDNKLIIYTPDTYTITASVMVQGTNEAIGNNGEAYSVTTLVDGNDGWVVDGIATNCSNIMSITTGKVGIASERVNVNVTIDISKLKTAAEWNKNIAGMQLSLVQDETAENGILDKFDENSAITITGEGASIWTEITNNLSDNGSVLLGVSNEALSDPIKIPTTLTFTTSIPVNDYTAEYGGNNIYLHITKISSEKGGGETKDVDFYGYACIEKITEEPTITSNAQANADGVTLGYKIFTKENTRKIYVKNLGTDGENNEIKVSDFKTLIGIDSSLFTKFEIKNKKSETLEDADKIGTGCTLTTKWGTSDTEKIYTIYVLGDIDSDGEIKINDYVELRLAIVGKTSSLSEDYEENATDIDLSNITEDNFEDRALGDIGDVIAIRRRILDHKWSV